MNDARNIVQDARALAVVFGPPSPVTATTVEVLKTITQVALRECAVVETNSLQSWEEACASGQHFIAVCQYPSPEICVYIEDHLVPSIVVVDDPLHAMAHLGGEPESEISAVRAVSASFSCLAEMMAQSETLIRSSNIRNLKAFLDGLAQLRGVEGEDPRFKQIEMQAEDFTSKLGDFSRREPDAAPPPAGRSALGNVALWHLEDVHRPGGGMQVEWPSSSFLLADFPGTPMQGPVDLAGPARCVLYGPYLHLPPGAWEAFIVVGFAGQDSAQSFTIEVVCHEIKSRGRFRSQGEGLFEVRMNFVHRHPHVPIELRLFSDVGAIDGVLDHFDVTLKRSG